MQAVESLAFSGPRGGEWCRDVVASGFVVKVLYGDPTASGFQTNGVAICQDSTELSGTFLEAAVTNVATVRGSVAAVGDARCQRRCR